MIGSNNKPGNFKLRAGKDDVSLGVVTAPGRSGKVAADLDVRTEIPLMFDRPSKRGDIVSGGFVEDVRAAGFDVVYAPTKRNPAHVRIIAGESDVVPKSWSTAM